ncbi:uncharacterized protein LOC142984266 [Anticarsia gemmatalis]|uniref:uncharacterized protein LOC142984266 n=1 Tax=Anticarsia gemmatalis TaxID=129554 RepID=UPI003F75BECA
MFSQNLSYILVSFGVFFMLCPNRSEGYFIQDNLNQFGNCENIMKAALYCRAMTNEIQERDDKRNQLPVGPADQYIPESTDMKPNKEEEAEYSSKDPHAKSRKSASKASLKPETSKNNLMEIPAFLIL